MWSLRLQIENLKLSTPMAAVSEYTANKYQKCYLEYLPSYHRPIIATHLTASTYDHFVLVTDFSLSLCHKQAHHLKPSAIPNTFCPQQPRVSRGKEQCFYHGSLISISALFISTFSFYAFSTNTELSTDNS